MADVFIAYHLGENSSYDKALYVKSIIEDMGFSVFLRDPGDASESYQRTNEIASQCNLFLLVVNKNVDEKCENLTQGTGKTIRVLSKECRIYGEINGYLKQFDGKVTGAAKGKIQCYCDENISPEYIENLHEAFYQMVHISNPNQLKHWVRKQLNHNKTIEDAVDKDWNIQLAEVWKNIYPPSRPSISEIGCYRKYFQKVRDDVRGDTPSVLILGSTIEFRKLAEEFEFNTIVVDYNEEYYTEISKEFPELMKREQLLVCDWADLENNESLQAQFDVIIGDLAIGNIKPSNLGKTFNGIFKLLRENGYFLGKNLYSFSRDKINRNTIEEMLKKFLESADAENPSLAYASTMYDLSIYATQNRNANKINFDEIYRTVQKECELLNKKNSKLYDVYCGDDTSFKDKMELSFYTYPIYEVIEKLQTQLYFYDTEYGKDIYSHKFPLLIFRKEKQTNFRLDHEKNRYFRQIKAYVVSQDKKEKMKDWAKYISAQYFIVKIAELFNIRGNVWNDIFDGIKSGIRDSMKIEITDDLMCFIESYYDEIIARETNDIENVGNLGNNQERLIGETYTLAILFYLTYTLSQRYSESNSVFNLVTEKLFNLPMQGEIWQPEEAPWVRAKICLAVKDIYPKLSDEYKRLINDTIEWIIYHFDEEKGEWPCNVGSRVDTKALCCEVLLTYYSIVLDDDIKEEIIKRVCQILDLYVSNSKIYETYALYPIGESVFDAIKAKETLRGKPMGKKLVTRIEFLSILIRLISFAKKHPTEFAEFEFDINELEKEEEFLIKRLMRFWDLFSNQNEDTVEILTSDELSSVLQILYSLAEAFDS